MSSISHRHKCVFVHLRRTGGNSIAQVLGGIKLLDKDFKPTTVCDNKLHRGDSPRKKLSRGTGIHATALRTREKYPEEFKKYYKFSVVRNPWAQMLSVYFRVETENSPAGFLRFLKTWDTPDGTVPRHSIFDSRGRLIVDKVVRFEDLSTGMAEVFDTLGIADAKLPFHNKSAGKNLSAYYSAEAKNIVANMYKEDIEFFDYAFPDE